MTTETRQQLFNYLSNELGVTPLESNLNEIEGIINPRKFPYIEGDNVSKEPIEDDISEEDIETLAENHVKEVYSYFGNSNVGRHTTDSNVGNRMNGFIAGYKAALKSNPAKLKEEPETLNN